MPSSRLITDDDAEAVQQFVHDMRSRTTSCPHDPMGRLQDVHGRGARLERDLFSGVTLVLDWKYLDGTTTYLLVSHNAPAYDRGNSTFMGEVGPLWEMLAGELRDVLPFSVIEYDNSADVRCRDVWKVRGVGPDKQGGVGDTNVGP